jgi:hypothetical protein
MTFHWVPEIEQATVSILWHEPERVAEFLREIDPAVHLYQPSLRIILEAIGIAYGELNCADWATVVEVVRELGHFGNAAGSGLMRFTATMDCRTPIFFAGISWKDYALARQAIPPRQFSL